MEAGQGDREEGKSIEAYHVHILLLGSSYSHLRSAQKLWLTLRKIQDQGLIDLELGRPWATPIGPHTPGSIQVWVSKDYFERLVSWLMVHRETHSCFIHPLTRYEITDHTERVLWLGTPTQVNTSMLSEDLGKANLVRPPRVLKPIPHYWDIRTGQTIVGKEEDYSSIELPNITPEEFEEERIQEYHVHVLFFVGDEAQLASATSLWHKLSALRDEKIVDIEPGRIWATPVGPHTLGNYQVWTPRESIERFIAWLMVNRGGHTCFIHPLTRNEILDHTERALWLGQPTHINVEPLSQLLNQAPLGRPARVDDPRPHYWDPIQNREVFK